MSVLFQELNVVDQLTVEQNLMLGKEKVRLGFFRRDTEAVARMSRCCAAWTRASRWHRRVGRPERGAEAGHRDRQGHRLRSPT